MRGPRTGLIGLALAASLPLAACSATLEPEVFEGRCVAGEAAPCACPGGVEGEQVCKDDASGFGACDCPPPPGDGECDDPRVGDPCEIGGARGRCKAGEFRCEDSVVRCFALNLPVDELCNGLDDDCDGVVDDGEPETGLECDTGGLGVCATGVSFCADGARGCRHGTTPADEACDGLDNDCDGEIDEVFAGMCDACAEPGGEGLCAQGLTVCLDGRVRCAPHLPADWAPPAEECDGLDSDCDGVVDETAEGLPPEPALLERARSACLLTPASPDSPGACPDDGGRTLGWGCTPTDDGGLCEALDCVEGFRIEDARCVPDVERCNDGVDDDGDGLVDGSVDGADPCMPTIDPRGETWRMGKCSPDIPGEPGCEDDEHVAYEGDHDTICWRRDTCPREVRASYRYALDREEVSGRAYMRCVEAGCCSPPAGRQYLLATQALEQGLAPARRPDDGDGCADRPRIHLGAPADAALLPDLPVVGVSWCQARNYCAWAGKRLPTEFEWDRAQRGPDPERRRRYAWGDADPVGCPEDLCLSTWRGDEVECRQLPPRDCPGCVFGPAPVWSGADGASAEGLLNMGGNVSEWVFDWYDDHYTDMTVDDPVGRGCHRYAPHTSRAVRDGHYASTRDEIRAGARSYFPQASHVQFLGFRCARTLPDDDSVCDPEMPFVPQDCAPPEGAPPACAAPSLTAEIGGDMLGCPDGGRRQTDHCLLGLVGWCAHEPVSCSAQIVTEARFEPEAIAEHLPPQLLAAMGEAVADLLEEDRTDVNELLAGVLAPSGGETLLVLNPPADFGRTFPHPVEFGSAILGPGGVLSWIGQEREERCDPAPRATLTVPTVSGSLDFEADCQVDDFSIWMVEAPIRFRVGAVKVRGELTASGTAVSSLAFMTLDDVDASIWGDPTRPADGFIRGVLEPFDLCPVAHVLGCGGALPGCTDEELESTCETPRTCTGYLLPFELRTARRDTVDIPGMAACAEE